MVDNTANPKELDFAQIYYRFGKISGQKFEYCGATNNCDTVRNYLLGLEPSWTIYTKESKVWAGGITYYFIQAWFKNGGVMLADLQYLSRKSKE